jgi:hypothetical protein
LTIDQFLKDYGLPVGMLLIALITGARGDWVFGREHRGSLEREDEWKQIAMRSLNVAESVTPKGRR